MEFVTKSLREAAPKLSIYFLYLSAQILVLASLLLVTADIIIHIILMILSIAFYFATAFKNVDLLLFSLAFTEDKSSLIMKILIIASPLSEKSRRSRSKENGIVKNNACLRQINPMPNKKQILLLRMVKKVQQMAKKL